MTVPTTYKSPLHQMSETTVTDYWNDSCSAHELRYGIEHGAVGATTNPVIVSTVLKNEYTEWKPRILELIAEHAAATEEEIGWLIIEEMAANGAALLRPIYDRTSGRKGRISIQTNPKWWNNADRMVAQAESFLNSAENINVKIPATRAGVEAIEELTRRGISVNATVSFTVAQAIAVAEAIERGLQRREAAGHDTSSMAPVCTIMVGRLDDWLKIVADREDTVVDPTALELAGVAVMKYAYRLYRRAGYRTRLLAAAYRNHYHWSEFIGGDVITSMPCKWARRFNNSDITVEERMTREVPESLVRALTDHFPDFRKAYEQAGLSISEFDTYPPTRRTLRQFIGGYGELCRMIRDLMVPDPD